MPDGATAYAENAQSPNQQAGPESLQGMTSPLQMGAGGVDLRYMAQRAVSYLRQVRESSGDESMYQEMEKMETSNPNLYKLVVPLLNDSGSRQDPMNAQKSPVTGSNQRSESRTV